MEQDDKSLGSGVRAFATGAVRDVQDNKLQLEGYLSPLVLERFGEYMLKHQHLADGSMRAADNWQKGMPLATYMDCGWRHFLDMWKAHRGWPSREGMEEAICGLLFNVMGYLHETLKARGYEGHKE